MKLDEMVTHLVWRALRTCRPQALTQTEHDRVENAVAIDPRNAVKLADGGATLNGIVNHWLSNSGWMRTSNATRARISKKCYNTGMNVTSRSMVSKIVAQGDRVAGRS